ncbi:laminin subunit alpha isoform X3 [Biomphalaria glabrata]|nr:laminin subunit alpha isoform X3 [Biomphalaria glabrata]
MDQMFLFVIISITFLNEEWCRIQVLAVKVCSFESNYFIWPRDGEHLIGTDEECERSCLDSPWCKGYEIIAPNCVLLSELKEGSVRKTIPLYVRNCQDICAIGQEYKNNNCSECDIGFYKDSDGNTNCTKCPMNIVTLGKGSISNSSCTITRCEKGFSSMDNEFCYACPNGTYKDSTGNQSCSKCPINKTTLNVGSTDIRNCSIALCESGLYTTDNITCFNCAKGTYKTGPGNHQCLRCPAHKTTLLVGSTDSRNCSIIHCEKGFFSKDNKFCSICPNATYKNFTGNQPCLMCPVNKTTTNVGSIDIRNCSLDCPSFCVKNNPCRNTVSSKCVCQNGYYGSECSKRCSPGCLNDACNIMNGLCLCKEGYYGAKCLKTGNLNQDNKWDSHYVKENCSEQVCLCSQGWFGQSCQYRDLGVDAIMDDGVLNDNNDSTCVKQNNITIDWQLEIQVVTWVRLVFTSNDDIADVEALYFEDQSSEPYESCDHHRLQFHKTRNTAIDFHCESSLFIRSLKVSWQSDSPLCSVYVSGARNVAPGSRKVKWRAEEKRPITIDTLTDGNYGNTGCLAMNSSVTLEFSFWKNVYSSEVRFFTDFTRDDGKGSFFIELFDESSKLRLSMSSSGNDVFVQRAFFMNMIVVSFIKIKVLSGSLNLCEVEIFGDCDTPYYGYSCVDVCYLTCLDQICTYEGECYLCDPSRTGIFCEDRTLNNANDSFESDGKSTEATINSLEAKSSTAKKSQPIVFVVFLLIFSLFFLSIVFLAIKNCPKK